MPRTLGTLFFILASVSVHGQTELARSIFTYEASYGTATGNFGQKIEEVFLFSLSPEFKLQGRYLYDQAEQTTNYGGLGGVVVFPFSSYTTFYYSLGWKSDQRLAHSAFWDFNYENDSVLAGVSAKLNSFPEDRTWFVLPSLYVSQTIEGIWVPLVRYILSANHANEYSHSLLFQNDFLLDKWRLRIGGSGGLVSNDAGISPVYSIMGGWRFNFLKTAVLSYTVEWDSSKTIRSSLSFDFKYDAEE